MPMTVERASSTSSLIDVLDRVLDKGIVIDVLLRVSLAGIDLITVEARVIVASFETYLKYADVFARKEPITTVVKQVPAGGVQLQLSDRLPTSPPRFSKTSSRS